MMHLLPFFASFVGRQVLGFTFAFAGCAKLLGVKEFERSLDSYRILPRTWLRSVARIVPVIEILLSAPLIVGLWVREAALGSLLLLVLFAAVLSFNLLRGVEFSCGCFGSGTGERASWWSVARNIALAGVSASLLSSASRWAGLQHWATSGSPPATNATELTSLTLAAFGIVLTAGLLGAIRRLGVLGDSRRVSETTQNRG